MISTTPPEQHAIFPIAEVDTGTRCISIEHFLQINYLASIVSFTIFHLPHRIGNSIRWLQGVVFDVIFTSVSDCFHLIPEERAVFVCQLEHPAADSPVDNDYSIHVGH